MRRKLKSVAEGMADDEEVTVTGWIFFINFRAGTKRMIYQWKIIGE